ncbi:MAG: chemotaxis protein CheW [Pseudomonadota bacterium]
MMAEQAPELQAAELSEAREAPGGHDRISVLRQAQDERNADRVPRMAGSKETGSFVVFRLDGERFALPLEEVELALRMVSVTPVPDAPPWVVGVIDLHGRVIPVTDLRQRLGHPAKEPHLDDRLLVMSLAERTFALVVDEVTEVLELPDSKVETPPDPLGDSRYLMAVVRREDGLILILDSANLFPTGGVGSE